MSYAIPLIKTHESKKFVVAFTDRHTGEVIKSTHPDWTCGEISDSWITHEEIATWLPGDQMEVSAPSQ